MHIKHIHFLNQPNLEGDMLLCLAAIMPQLMTLTLEIDNKYDIDLNEDGIREETIIRGAKTITVLNFLYC